jgi:hypothetical protein
VKTRGPMGWHDVARRVEVGDEKDVADGAIGREPVPARRSAHPRQGAEDTGERAGYPNAASKGDPGSAVLRVLAPASMDRAG